MDKIAVAVVDDHALVREGIKALFASETDLHVVGEAEDGAEGISIVLKTHPDVILMDLALPKLNGLDATRRLLQLSHDEKVIILTSYAQDEYVKRAVQSGAMGYILKQTAPERLIGAIRKVHGGQPYFDLDLSRALRETCYRAVREHGVVPGFEVIARRTGNPTLKSRTWRPPRTG